MPKAFPCQLVVNCQDQGAFMTHPLTLPYLQQLDERGSLKVWLVDGSYIRGNIDEEFTNFGQHYRFPYIPENELWIDQERSPDERAFFIDHLIVEHQLMKQGATYEEAIVKADQAERKERRRAGDIKPLTNDGKTLPDPVSVHRELWKKLENGLTVWIVNGRLVRSVFDIDFTAGGHDKVYEFVPAKEVWIDDDIVEKERGYVLLHELHERNRMAAGLPYSLAHAESSRLEYRCRHHPDTLHDALAREGWA
ncbi:MAG: hypothetical protein ABSF95_09880 [Verrucomicrobiota bacterium]